MSIDTTFFGLLRKHQIRFRLSEPVETNRLASGEVLTASLGAALWVGEITCFQAHYSVAQEIEARIDKLQRPGEFFEAYDPRFNGPKSDPDGVLLGASTPVIASLGGDNRSLTLSGLPSGYELSAGDYIGWQYGTNPVRFAVHRLATGATADGAGLTPIFEVSPHVRTGVTVGTAVNLVRPRIKARLMSPDYGNARPMFTEGARFSFTQTLR
ncbi:hypothetical protein [Leisingera sp.]|uniref:hypothetical protein n=1 Tax=Leisingera sp. TaxID=1879318 RepID=UPI002B279A10|nr:hypothetical protein [Leisingera sp.]